MHADAADTSPAPSRGEATRARLLDAGRTVFARRGYRATRVGDIVAEAGTSQGTFYLYFSSKDDLFDSLQSEVTSEFTRLAESLPDLGPDPDRVAALQSWIQQLLLASDRHRPMLRAGTEADSTRGRESIADHLGSLGSALAARSGLRGRRSFDPEVAALALVSTLERLDHMAGDGRLDVGDDDLARTTARIVTDALYGPSATGGGDRTSERERSSAT